MTLNIKRCFRTDRSNCFESKLIDFISSNPSLVNLKKELSNPLLKLNKNKQEIYFSTACEVAKRKAAIIAKEGIFRIKKDDKDDFYLERLKGLDKLYVRVASLRSRKKSGEECYLPSYHSNIEITGFKRR